MSRVTHYLAMSGLAVMLTFANSAYAGDGWGKGGGKGKGKHGWHKGGEKRHEKMMQHLEDLGLSEDQRTKIKSLHESHRAEMEAQRDAMKASHEAFRDAMKSADKTDDELTAMHEKIVSTRSDEMRMRFKHMLQIRGILTPEQRAKFRGMMREGPED